MKQVLFAALAGALLAGALVWHWRPTPPPGPPIVRVDTAWMEHERPDLAKPSLGEKLTTGRVKPTQTRVAEAPSGAGKKAVETYCAPAIALQTSADSTPSSKADIQQSSALLLPDFAGRVAGNRVTLYSTLNNGARWAADYRPRGHWSFETDGDSVLMRSDRFWVRALRGGRRCVVSGAIGAAAGGLLGLVIAEPRGGMIGGAAAGCVVGAF